MTMPPQQTLQNARSTARKSRSGGMPVSTPVARATHEHISGTKPRREIGESGLGAHCMRLLCQPILEETGNAAVSGNFPRRYYPDRVQRDSLSLAARFSVVSKKGDACRSTPVSSSIIKT